MMQCVLRLFVALALVASPGLASAHTGIGETGGFAHGFAHPFGGIDHLLAMIGVGVFARHLGGRALWLVPASFVTIMMGGGMLGTNGIALPFVESAIALSVIVLGVAIVARVDMPTLAAMAMVGIFAVFHGHAHGVEMPETVSGLSYGAGFVLATSILHLAGVSVGFGLDRAKGVYGDRALTLGGGTMALTGVVLLAGAV
jgi:urease accessory protein